MNFSEVMLAKMGPRVIVPEPILAFFRWVDANNLGRTCKAGNPYALIDPALEHSCVGLVPPDPDHATAWVGGGSTDEVRERLVPFCTTGGDGSYAAFWVDKAGKTRIVHLGSGSGSTMIGVMVDDPVDFLRLLAIGYDEFCFPANHDLTPEELHEEEYPTEDYEGMEDDKPPAPEKPKALRQWVASQFHVTIPECASEIVKDMPDMMDEDSTDPFVRWLNEMQKR